MLGLNVSFISDLKVFVVFVLLVFLVKVILFALSTAIAMNMR